MDLNLHIYPSYLINESRILREAQSLTSLGLVQRIFVTGFWKTGLAEKEQVLPNVFLFRIKTAVKKREGLLKVINLLSFPLFYFKIIGLCRRDRPSVVNCHSLTVLPLGFFLKHRFGARLIYDPHELETESNESRGARRILARVIEKTFVHSAEAVIVVSHHIADWYQKRYGLTNVSVVKNVPLQRTIASTSSVLRRSLGLSDKDIVFLYVGVLEYGRGIDLLLDAFKGLHGDRHLVMLGYGAYREEIIRTSKSNSNIHYLNAVSPDKVLEYVSGADVGVCLIQNTCLSYYYCLPNKAFEYIGAGVPFISSDFPELRREFGPFGLCWFTDIHVEKIKDLIKSITRHDIATRKQAVLKHRANWSWDVEEKKYIDVFHAVRKKRAPKKN